MIPELMEAVENSELTDMKVLRQKPTNIKGKCSQDYFQQVFSLLPDNNDEREYWKGFRIVEWSNGDKELRLCYWTRKRGTKAWKWGQFNTIIGVDKLKKLLRMLERV